MIAQAPTEQDPIEMAICSELSDDERTAFDNIMPIIRTAIDQSMRPQEEEKSNEDWPFTDRFLIIDPMI